VQTKNRIVSKCANNAILNIVSVFRTYLPKPTILGTLIVNNFLIKSVQTKIYPFVLHRIRVSNLSAKADCPQNFNCL